MTNELPDKQPGLVFRAVENGFLVYQARWNGHEVEIMVIPQVAQSLDALSTAAYDWGEGQVLAGAVTLPEELDGFQQLRTAALEVLAARGAMARTPRGTNGDKLEAAIGKVRLALGLANVVEAGDDETPPQPSPSLRDGEGAATERDTEGSGEFGDREASADVGGLPAVEGEAASG